MKTCVVCGSRHTDEMRFCGSCGSLLQSALPIGTAERRQVTVVFCDLVDSTPLSQRVDPEDFATILVSFRKIAAASARRHGGHVVRRLGDGILLCFGYPTAHEEDSVNAVRCGFEIVEAIRSIDLAGIHVADWVPAARVGIHTGVAVVGELGSGEAAEASALVGEVPNLASRIHQQSEIHRVVISATTHGLVRRRIECRPLGAITLKGVRDPISLFEVVNVRPDLGDPLNVGQAAAGPPVGREAAYELILERWALARDGDGQIGIVVAEAGMGKSHLARAIAARAAADGARVLVARCLAETAGSVFHPLATMLRRELRLEGATIDQAQTLVRSMVQNMGGGVEASIAVATLLGVNEPHGGSNLLSAAVDRAQAFALIFSWIIEAPAASPTLLVVEDLHFADPSTLEFLGGMVERVAGTACLLVATSRPGFAPSWGHRSYGFILQLGRLSTSAVEVIVRNLDPDGALSDGITRRIAGRSDGVPLYIEEMTKEALEQSRSATKEIPTAVWQPGGRIPATLQEALLSRLDRLSSAKAIAQLAACLGTEFTSDLLMAVDGSDETNLGNLLESLVTAEILVRRGRGREARYSFRHGLLREIAYDSLLRSGRRALHGRIAAVISSQFPGLAATFPGVLAHHCAAGEMPEKAIQYWRIAAQRAYVSSGFVEAAEFLRSALSQVLQIEDERSRDSIELSLQIDLGTAFIATRGEASPEVEGAYGRAETLLRKTGAAELPFGALRGLQSFYQVRGPLDASRRLAERLQEIADASGDKVAQVEARRRLGWCVFCQGDFETGRRLLEETLALYDPENAKQHIMHHSVDPAVLGRINLAWLEACAGQRRRAEDEVAAAISYGEALGHGLSLAYALGIAAAIHQTLDDRGRAEMRANDTLALARQRHLPYWIAFGTLMQGWSQAAAGNVAALAELDMGLAAYRASGARLFVPYGLSLRADILLRQKRSAEAEATIAEATREAVEVQCHFLRPELLRLGACALLQMKGGRDPATISAFDAALDAADRLGAGITASRIVADARTDPLWASAGLNRTMEQAEAMIARRRDQT